MIEFIFYLALAYLTYKLWRHFKGTASAHPTFTRPKGALAESHAIQPSKRIGGLLKITYTDANRATTQRTVSLHSYQLGQPSGFTGFCYLRHESRTFRLDRVQQAIDQTTGEIISDLPNWLEAQYRYSPQGIAETIKATKPHHPPVLAHIAKADGAMRAAEVKIIGAHIATLAGSPALEDTAVREVLQQFPAADFNNFQYHARQIAQHSTDDLKHITQVARAIIGTQKTVHDNEARALAFLESLLPTNNSQQGTP